MQWQDGISERSGFSSLSQKGNWLKKKKKRQEKEEHSYQQAGWMILADRTLCAFLGSPGAES